MWSNSNKKEVEIRNCKLGIIELKANLASVSDKYKKRPEDLQIIAQYNLLRGMLRKAKQDLQKLEMANLTAKVAKFMPNTEELDEEFEESLDIIQEKAGYIPYGDDEDDDYNRDPPPPPPSDGNAPAYINQIEDKTSLQTDKTEYKKVVDKINVLKVETQFEDLLAEFDEPKPIKFPDAPVTHFIDLENRIKGIKEEEKKKQIDDDELTGMLEA